ncbi:MAG: hypothetical protein MUC92_02440 [Fimbriimonadaceae bacterium]|jgi:hypothetical protein|nr:hypothetical protein [Fimbriimonadaceae bacterium]
MNDKKKLMVVGILLVVILAVGAFQFMGSSTPASAAATKKEEITKEAEGAELGSGGEEEAKGPAIDPALQPLIAGTFPSRDPFLPAGARAMETPKSVSQTPPSQAQNLPNPVTGPSSAPPPPRISTNRPRYEAPDPMRGSLPPINPGAPNGPQNPTQPIVVVPTYRLKGVLLGDRPLAVFEDSKGNQKLVPLGGSIDADTIVVSIEKGKVTIRSKGKERTLVIEEEARD